MKLHQVIFSSLLCLSLPLHAGLVAEQALTPAPPLSLFESWNAPVEPFQIFNQLYYVGTENLSSVLIDTGAGLVLIDSGMDQSAAQIKQNIEKLGFKITDVKYLLNSHARLDQAGGFAKLKQWSGAKLVASAENAKMLKNGAATDFALGNQLPFPAVNADIIIQDGDQISLGQQVFTAHLTPGHLPGSTSWTTDITQQGKKYHVIYADSLFTGGYYLINNKNYPTIVQDMQHSLNKLNAIHADIFLANKADRFNMQEKRQQLQAGNQNAFIDDQALQRYVAQGKADFAKQLAEQQQ